MIRNTLTLLLLSALILPVFSQSDNEREAFQTYKDAREAYQAENFKNAAYLLTRTKQLLGSTNIRIQPMLIRSLVAIEDWRQAKQELIEYYNLNPDKELVEYRQITELSAQIDRKIQEEERLFRDAKSRASIEHYKKYLDTYPYGKYRGELEGLMSDQYDENGWTIARDKSNTAAYYDYLAAFPDGKYAEVARTTIDRWDNEASQKALNEGTQESLKYYLDYYPRGKYRSEVNKKLEEKKEYDVYMYAKNNNYIGNYETYISQYPKGKYAEEVNDIIELSYYRFGNDEYAKDNYSQAKQYFQTYLSKFPGGMHVADVRDKINKCDRKMNQRGASYFMYTYDKESPVGFGFGELYKSSTGYYFNLKNHPDILKGLGVLYNIDNTGYSDSPWGIRHTGEVRATNIGLSMGVTFPVVYPLWGYIGGGLIYYTQFEQIEEYDSFGDLYEIVWMRNTDETSVGIFPEAGLLLKLGGAVVLKSGILYRGGVIGQLGIAIQY